MKDLYPGSSWDQPGRTYKVHHFTKIAILEAEYSPSLYDEMGNTHYYIYRNAPFPAPYNGAGWDYPPVDMDVRYSINLSNQKHSHKTWLDSLSQQRFDLTRLSEILSDT